MRVSPQGVGAVGRVRGKGVRQVPCEGGREAMRACRLVRPWLYDADKLMLLSGGR